MNLANHKIHYVMKDLMAMNKLYGGKLIFKPHELLFFMDLWEPLDAQILPIRNQIINDLTKKLKSIIIWN